jgi:hypothetical protein
MAATATTAYVASCVVNEITPIDLATGQVGQQIVVPIRPTSLAISRDEQTLFVGIENDFGGGGTVEATGFRQ